MASFMDFPIESTDLNNNYSSEPNNNYYVEVDLDEIFIDYSINSSNDDLDNMIRDIDISDEHFDHTEANDENVGNHVDMNNNVLNNNEYFAFEENAILENANDPNDVNPAIYYQSSDDEDDDIDETENNLEYVPMVEACGQNILENKRNDHDNDDDDDEMTNEQNANGGNEFLKYLGLRKNNRSHGSH